MGSDSRTATASNTRPSWRNRHLNQLSDDQLDEVKQHRDSSGSVSEMVGVESTGSVAVKEKTASEDATNAKLPRQQAGPARADLRRDHKPAHRRDNRPDGRRDGRPDNRYEQRDDQDVREDRHAGAHRRSEPDRRRESSGRSQSGHGSRHESRDNRQFDDRDYSKDRHRSEQHPEQSRQDRDRAERSRHESRHRPERHVAPDRGYDHRNDASVTAPEPQRQPQPESADAAVKNKKGFVAKVLNFNPSRPVKYGLMALAIVFMIAVSLLKPIDSSSQSQLDSSLTRAMIGFGLARTLNGVISVAQGTEFAVQPAGVGVNFSPGEILDPINDLVERFSLVMLLATSALGAQKILLEVSSWTGISVLLAGAGLFFLLTRMRNSSMARMADIASRLLLLMLLVRFLIPVGSLANDWVYKQFLEPRYEESAAQLEIASERIKEISTRQTQVEEAEGSLKDRAKRLYSSMTSKFDFEGMLDDYKQSAENVSEHAINLIVVFTLQTIIFPLLFLYLVYRLFRSVVLPSRPS